MNAKKRGGTLLIVLGLLLVASALALTVHNLYQDYSAGSAAKGIVRRLQAQISDGNQDTFSADGPSAELPDYVVNPDMEMPALELDGNEYIGILEIPDLGLSLPIMSQWSYPKLRIAPCRYSGSAYSGAFTIAGHNYSSHFGPVRTLPVGAQILFTDLEGRRFVYEVQAVETLEPSAIQDMLSDQWDLTLFTCTTGGRARVAVRCLRLE